MTAKARRKRLESLYWAQSGLCHICGQRMFLPGTVHKNDPRVTTFDHVFPRNGKRGKDGNANLLAACRSCNTERGNTAPTPKMIVLSKLVWAVRAARGQIQSLRS